MKNAKIKDKKSKVKSLSDIKIKSQDKILCVILGENSFSHLIWVDTNLTRFSYHGNTYFLIKNDGYITNDKLLLYVYLEGISTPIGHRYVKRKTINREIKLEGTKTKVIPVTVIDGLKHDSKVIDRLLNSGLAEIFTKIREDKMFYMMFFMIIILIVISIINVGVTVYFNQ